jgi:hypothetical protein
MLGARGEGILHSGLKSVNLQKKIGKNLENMAKL